MKTLKILGKTKAKHCSTFVVEIKMCAASQESEHIAWEVLALRFPIEKFTELSELLEDLNKASCKPSGFNRKDYPTIRHWEAFGLNKGWPGTFDGMEPFDYVEHEFFWYDEFGIEYLTEEIEFDERSSNVQGSSSKREEHLRKGTCKEQERLGEDKQ